MRKLIFLIVSLVSMVACQSESPSSVQNVGLVGKWKLVEFLSDPGNGSGTWQKADPQNPLYVEFKADGTFSSNMYTDLISYKVVDDTQLQLTFDPKLNSGNFTTWRYTNLTNTTLTLTYACREPCGGRFVSVSTQE
ncbi:MAG: hypothetical protein U0Y10_24200 [Spirosomataceae bacterium]